MVDIILFEKIKLHLLEKLPIEEYAFINRLAYYLDINHVSTAEEQSVADELCLEAYNTLMQQLLLVKQNTWQRNFREILKTRLNIRKPFIQFSSDEKNILLKSIQECFQKFLPETYSHVLLGRSLEYKYPGTASREESWSAHLDAVQRRYRAEGPIPVLRKGLYWSSNTRIFLDFLIKKEIKFIIAIGDFAERDSGKMYDYRKFCDDMYQVVNKRQETPNITHLNILKFEAQEAVYTCDFLHFNIPDMGVIGLDDNKMKSLLDELFGKLGELEGPYLIHCQVGVGRTSYLALLIDFYQDQILMDGLFHLSLQRELNTMLDSAMLEQVVDNIADKICQLRKVRPAGIDSKQVMQALAQAFSYYQSKLLAVDKKNGFVLTRKNSNESSDISEVLSDKSLFDDEIQPEHAKKVQPTRRMGSASSVSSPSVSGNNLLKYAPIRDMVPKEDPRWSSLKSFNFEPESSFHHLPEKRSQTPAPSQRFFLVNNKKRGQTPGLGMRVVRERSSSPSFFKVRSGGSDLAVVGTAKKIMDGRRR